MAATVLLIGTLDTKGDELAFMRDRLALAGVEVLVADAGTVDPPRGLEPAVTREPLAAEVGAHLATLTGWKPMVLLAIYAPAGAEQAKTLPDYREVAAGEAPPLEPMR